jgi:hypothetical protein
MLTIVQVRFDACDGFEFTQEMCVFDMCKISLYHCWVYDPQNETGVAAAMGRRHYNEARSINTMCPPPPPLAANTPPGGACSLQLSRLRLPRPPFVTSYGTSL